MSAATAPRRPRFAWYGDDFTGATDTLATWAERGYRALLFLRVPTPAQLAAAVALMHYKCCSTFDSSAHIGSIGAAVKALKRYFANPFVPIVGGQPNLGRY